MFLINAVAKQDFKADSEFRRIFNGYYKVRQRKAEWYDKYYSLMEDQKKAHRSFKEILVELKTFGNVEVSFSSKLISTIETDKPIWDSYVLRNLGLWETWTQYQGRQIDERIEKAVSIYDTICSCDIKSCKGYN